MADSEFRGGTLEVFDYGDTGVNLSEVPIDRRPGDWEEAQNGQPGYIETLGALEKRGGLAALNDDVLAGAILAMLPIAQPSPLAPPAPGAGLVYAQIDTGALKPWYTTDDFSTFDLESALGGETNRYPVNSTLAGVSLLVFLADSGASQELLGWNGSTVLTFIGASAWPAIGSAAFVQAVGLAERFGSVYVLCEYGDDKTYVLHTRLSLGTIEVVGGTSVGVANQTPQKIAINTDGNLYVAVDSPAGTDASMYRYDTSGPGPWVNESNFESPFPVVGDVTALATYNGVMYAAVQETGQPAKIIKRTTSAWTDIVNTFATASSVVLWLAVFDDLLFAGLDGPAPESEVWSYDGATWSLDKDVWTDFSVHITEHVVVALSRLVIGADDATLLTRTATPTWAQSGAIQPTSTILLLGKL